ncbi:porin [Neisseriaceae bacterium TC5R-5]|nr:porin [Neisseriaceae bacterium TC5R-5]
MHNKLIALALTALPTVAIADVVIYGEIRGAYEYNKTYSSGLDRNSEGKLLGSSQINDWTSRIGFKGGEDLGNGLKAIWQVESRLYIDGADSTGFATRDSFIGFAGNDWGKLRLGKLSNYANSDMGLIDPGYYSGKSVAGLGSFTRIDDRVTNAVRYDSPVWEGFSFIALYGTDEKRVLANDGSGSNTNNQTWNLGLSYEHPMGFFAKYNYENWGDAQKAAAIGPLGNEAANFKYSNNTKTWHRVEAGYNANNIYAVLGYQQIEGYGLGSYYNNSNNGLASASSSPVAALNAALLANGTSQANINQQSLKTKEAAVTLGYSFGALTPYFSYAKGYNVSQNGSSVTDSGYDQYVLSLSYNLSKRTNVHTSYGHVKWKFDNLDNENSFGLGVIHRF